MTRVAGDAVAPAEEDVVLVRCCREGGCAAVVVGAGACHGATFHGVGLCGDFILQWGEDCGVGGIAFHEDATRVGDVAIAPLAEHIACVAMGRKVDGRAIVVGAAAVDGTRVFRIDFGGDDTLSDLEMCGEGLILGDDDGAWVGCDAVVPSGEGEAHVGCGFNLDGVAVIIGATACHGAPTRMIGDDFDGVLAFGEEGDEGAVLRDNDVAWVVDDAVIPSEELMTEIGNGFDLDGVAIRIGTPASDGAPIKVVGFDGDGEKGHRRSGKHTNAADGFTILRRV